MFGEVIICQFPFTSGTGSKIRPALVLFDLSEIVIPLVWIPVRQKFLISR